MISHFALRTSQAKCDFTLVLCLHISMLPAGPCRQSQGSFKFYKAGQILKIGISNSHCNLAMSGSMPQSLPVSVSETYETPLPAQAGADGSDVTVEPTATKQAPVWKMFVRTSGESRGGSPAKCLVCHSIILRAKSNTSESGGSQYRTDWQLPPSPDGRRGRGTVRGKEGKGEVQGNRA